jgi:hypothetical protein
MEVVSRLNVTQNYVYVQVKKVKYIIATFMRYHERKAEIKFFLLLASKESYIKQQQITIIRE